MEVERVTRNTPATLSVTFYADEATQDADGPVVVTILRADGSPLTTGNATHVGVAGSGVYTFDLSSQANLNQLTASWVGDFSGEEATITTGVEIVGGRYFTVSELRAEDAALADTTKYPLASLVNARDAVESDFERICSRAFVPRFCREVIVGNGTDTIYLSKNEPLTVLTIDTVSAVSTDFWSDSFRALTKAVGVWEYGHRYTIEYEYGSVFVPTDIKRVALRRARGTLVSGRSRIDERATMMQIPDFGTFNLATPGKAGSWTGVPDIDVVLNDFALGRGGVW